ncbi:carboxypeptidase O-like [Tigriopus californicus]|uniref:carboxypeptidase O-like n=1 Tax=Tigriopus californicus TaxID=6832 RepID=UPI0027DA7797|nr:carboxypeptidase O-like [Tigriopus californicus]
MHLGPQSLTLFALLHWSMGDNGNGYLVNVIPVTESALQLLTSIRWDYDFLELDEDLQKPAVVHLTEADKDEFLSKISDESQFKFEFLDLQGMIEEERRQNNGTLSRQGSFDLNIYHPLNEIEDFLQSKQRDHPAMVNVTTIGRTHNGQYIQMITIKLTREDIKMKPAIWIDCGIHAREHISPATCLGLIDRLINQGEKGPLEHFDFFILPVFNPDGYAYTWSNDRMWRKNRRPITRSCTGVDLNRNFVPNFGGPSTSSNPCSNIYKGTKAFSEPETRAVAVANLQIMKKYGRDMFPLHMSFHSYGQMILRPYSHGVMPPPNLRELDAIGNVMLKSVARSRYTYRYGTSAAILYAVGGASADWAYHQGVPYPFTIELPPQTSGGFIYPASNIKRTYNHIWKMVNAMTRHLRRNGYKVQKQ